MEAKRTPGPWEVVALSGVAGPYAIRMAYIADPAASPTFYGVREVARKQDAHLIAAAPDVLEAARAVVNGYRNGPNGSPGELAWVRLEAAIAKAEGRPSPTPQDERA